MLSREVDEAREIGGQIYYPHTLVTLGRERDFQMRIHAAEKAELTVGLLEYASPVRIHTEALSDAYQVNFPLQGQLRMTYGDQKILASPRIAAIHGTDRETGLEGWDSPTTMLGLKIPQRVLDRELEVLLGRTPEAPVVFAGSLD
ncbi:MAG: hypothetical protein ABWX68_14520, partial [Arthrobacter sp.]|uniref:cupin domain-containing protein n=1 Tax=Arthrobacter sp. TaxID=1667 RepID=UPI00347A17B5